MVSKNSQNRHCLSIPVDWDLPKFSLGEQVQVTTQLPDITLIQTGLLVGVEYFRADNLWVIEGITAGWHYYIQVDANDPWHTKEPVLCVEESAINKLTTLD
ncbi:hypothetical protein [Lyngbya aestuarii]|uniref:hypothetical protein n=1 Tax=Lyngbya aestuarii TaxID=118322 RepID=UPI00403E11C4